MEVTTGGDGPLILDGIRDVLAPYLQRPFPPAGVLDDLGTVVQHSVTVENTGTLDADDVVLGFLVPPGAGKDGVPRQILYDFARVHVKAGESVTVHLNATALDFTQVNDSGIRSVLPGDFVFQFGIPETQDLGQGFARQALRATLS